MATSPPTSARSHTALRPPACTVATAQHNSIPAPSSCTGASDSTLRARRASTPSRRGRRLLRRDVDGLVFSLQCPPSQKRSTSLRAMASCRSRSCRAAVGRAHHDRRRTKGQRLLVDVLRGVVAAELEQERGALVSLCAPRLRVGRCSAGPPWHLPRRTRSIGSSTQQGWERFSLSPRRPTTAAALRPPAPAMACAAHRDARWTAPWARPRRTREILACEAKPVRLSDATRSAPVVGVRR